MASLATPPDDPDWEEEAHVGPAARAQRAAERRVFLDDVQRAAVASVGGSWPFRRYALDEMLAIRRAAPRDPTAWPAGMARARLVPVVPREEEGGRAAGVGPSSSKGSQWDRGAARRDREGGWDMPSEGGDGEAGGWEMPVEELLEGDVPSPDDVGVILQPVPDSFFGFSTTILPPRGRGGAPLTAEDVERERQRLRAMHHAQVGEVESAAAYPSGDVMGASVSLSLGVSVLDGPPVVYVPVMQLPQQPPTTVIEATPALPLSSTFSPAALLSSPDHHGGGGPSAGNAGGTGALLQQLFGRVPPSVPVLQPPVQVPSGGAAPMAPSVAALFAAAARGTSKGVPGVTPIISTQHHQGRGALQQLLAQQKPRM